MTETVATNGTVRRGDVTELTEEARAEIIARREELGPILLKLYLKMAKLNYEDTQRVKIDSKRYAYGGQREWQNSLVFFSKSTSYSKTHPTAEYQFFWLGNNYDYTAENVEQVGKEIEELIRLTKIEKWHGEVRKDLMLAAKCWRLPYIVYDESDILIERVMPFGPRMDLLASFHSNHVNLTASERRNPWVPRHLGRFQYTKENCEGLPDDVYIGDEELKNGYNAFARVVSENREKYSSKICKIWEKILDFFDAMADIVRGLLSF